MVIYLWGKFWMAAWRGPTRRYDILKEGIIATVVILILTVARSAPDR